MERKEYKKQKLASVLGKRRQEDFFLKKLTTKGRGVKAKIWKMIRKPCATIFGEKRNSASGRKKGGKVQFLA